MTVECAKIGREFSCNLRPFYEEFELAGHRGCNYAKA
jgi:hypothetical protein